MGLGIDRLQVYTCILVSTLGSTLSVFLLWGFSYRFPTLLVFSSVYGLFAGCWSSTYPGVVSAVKSEFRLRRERSESSEGNGLAGSAQRVKDVDGMMVLAMMGVGRGIGNLVSGPVSEALVKAGGLGAYGAGYGNLVVFTGVSAFCGGVGVLRWRPGGRVRGG